MDYPAPSALHSLFSEREPELQVAGERESRDENLLLFEKSEAN